MSHILLNVKDETTHREVVAGLTTRFGILPNCLSGFTVYEGALCVIGHDPKFDWFTDGKLPLKDLGSSDVLYGNAEDFYAAIAKHKASAGSTTENLVHELRVEDLAQGLRVRLKDDCIEYAEYGVFGGAVGTLHVIDPFCDENVGVVFDGYTDGHNFRGALWRGADVPPLPVPNSGLWVSLQDLTKV